LKIAQTLESLPAGGFVFDLDGTLVDSAYQHAFAWQQALQIERLYLSLWHIHRHVGMSGALLTEQLLRLLGCEISTDRVERLQQHHAQAYKRLAATVELLPGALELLRSLRAARIEWIIATSGYRRTAEHDLGLLELAESAVVSRDDVQHAKPNPDVFLLAAMRLQLPPASIFVVGDSVWDMLAARRAGMFGVGLLSGGYGAEELERAGAARVYEDPADLLAHLHELGIRV